MSSQHDEVNIPGLHAQILANLRITHPHVAHPIITTSYSNELWSAIVFDKTGALIQHYVGRENTAVGALRVLLRVTSEKIEDKYMEVLATGDC